MIAILCADFNQLKMNFNNFVGLRLIKVPSCPKEGNGTRVPSSSKKSYGALLLRCRFFFGKN